MSLRPTFFLVPAHFHAWLEAHHDKVRELLVGFYKKSSGKPSITWPESVQVRLCFGWIDGIRKSIDETSYMIRFTPRKPTSTWSSINVKFVAELTKKGLMQQIRHATETGANRRSGFAPTKSHGNSSVLNLLGTRGFALFGSSAQKRKRRNSSGFRQLIERSQNRRTRRQLSRAKKK
jgi:hypothetical protein